MAGVLAGCEKHAPETKDRLSPEAMEEMAEEPIAAVRKQGLASGQARFQQLLAANEDRYGPDSVQVADLLMAFGVGLYSAGLEDEKQGLNTAGFNRWRALCSSALLKHSVI
jgi:hypothetical protein